MDYLADFAADEFTVYASSDDIEEWSSGTDELGNPIFDSAVIADNLRCETI